jgi:hypothetical protein
VRSSTRLEHSVGLLTHQRRAPPSLGRASVAELVLQTLAQDEQQARRLQLAPRLLLSESGAVAADRPRHGVGQQAIEQSRRRSLSRALGGGHPPGRAPKESSSCREGNSPGPTTVETDAAAITRSHSWRAGNDATDAVVDIGPASHSRPPTARRARAGVAHPGRHCISVIEPQVRRPGTTRRSSCGRCASADAGWSRGQPRCQGRSKCGPVAPVENWTTLARCRGAAELRPGGPRRSSAGERAARVGGSVFGRRRHSFPPVPTRSPVLTNLTSGFGCLEPFPKRAREDSNL